MKYLIFYIILYFSCNYTPIFAADNTQPGTSILEGIPQSFDAEYSHSDDYQYYTLEEILSIFYDEKNPNKKVSAIGYIGRDSTFKLSHGELLLQRYFVTCCISHAKPVSIYLLTDNPDLFNNDEWIKVNGTIVTVTKDFGNSPAIKVEKIVKIPKPNNPYLNCDACSTKH
jgi:uncharacterized membrane protein YcgQ (UPF0703/DUF1980 family)